MHFGAMKSLRCKFCIRSRIPVQLMDFNALNSTTPSGILWLKRSKMNKHDFKGQCLDAFDPFSGHSLM